VPIRVEAQTGCCIAVSYQAKAYGVKTGFNVADAKLLCPHIILVEARPAEGSTRYPSIRSSQSAAENVNVYLRPAAGADYEAVIAGGGVGGGAGIATGATEAAAG
jgi:nucleotidyltransferase/DNA polymerase involved in DNA repair